MNKNKMFLLILLILLLSGCTQTDLSQPVAGASVVYDEVYEAVVLRVTLIGFFVGLFLALAVGFFLSAKRVSPLLYVSASLGLVIVSTIIGLGIGLSMGETLASRSMSDIAPAKIHKATAYWEYVHVPASRTIVETRECVHKSNMHTGCEYEWSYDYNYHEVCQDVPVQKDGETVYVQDCREEHDTMYVPYFTQEEKRIACFSLPDSMLKDGVGGDTGTGLYRYSDSTACREYTSWQAPEDYDRYWYRMVDFRLPPPLTSFDYKIPQEWKQIKLGLQGGEAVVVTVKHHYANWFYASPNNNFIQNSHPDKGRYLEAGLLPAVPRLYSRWGSEESLWGDYDPIQFNGVVVDDSEKWQTAAKLFAMDLGRGDSSFPPTLILWFVPAESVDNPDSWISAAKSYLSDVASWGSTPLARNVILIGCGVDQSQQMIVFCRMETGMPGGNVEAKYFVNDLSGIGFTPEELLGEYEAWTVPQENQFHETKIELAVPGALSTLKELYSQVEMDDYAWLMEGMDLTREDVRWIVRRQTWGINLWGWILGLLAAALAVVSFVYFKK